jgi:hypothetical protein
MRVDVKKDIITDQMIEILIKKTERNFFFLKGKWCNSLVGGKNFNNVRKRPIGYEEK